MATKPTEATGLIVYVCNRHSPSQPGMNENTNGLLRQWFRTLGFGTPAHVFTGLAPERHFCAPRPVAYVPFASGRRVARSSA